MKKFFRFCLIVALLALLIGGTAYGWQKYANQRKLKALEAQLAEGPRDRETFREVRKQVQTLPVAYQQQFGRDQRDRMMQRMQQNMEEYFALDKAARRAELDRRIAEEEKRRKQWEAERANRQANGGNNNNGSGGRGGGNGNGNGGQGGGGGGRGLAARLNNTTPQFRAMMAGYRLDMDQRRHELGLPPPPRRRWR